MNPIHARPRPSLAQLTARLSSAIIVALTLVSCGGGGSDSSNGAVTATTNPPSANPPPSGPPTQAEASRFLGQASFGATAGEIVKVSAAGYDAWLTDQINAPQTLHQPYIDSLPAALNANGTVPQNWIYETFWQKAVTAPDQLRHRVAFALSEIFVISLVDGAVAQQGRGAAAYMDMLGKHAFGNFRTLLEAVSLHPMMGLYLSHLRNQKEDPVRGRVPDENYAREVMQLFTIGLVELNPDGTAKLVNGQPKETYTNDDVTGLARVFTGFSWAGPDKSSARFLGNVGTRDANRDVLPMQGYPQFHSQLEKSFLGTTIAAQASADPNASLKAALDHLFAHPNVGPFFGKQLIQRLVTSNPSPAYVARVSAVFANNGQGVRGDMQALIRAILLDSEARDPAGLANPQFGKVREPVVRVANWLRAFNATSISGRFLIPNTDNPAAQLGQTPLRSPSVFNFFRPGYVAPNTATAQAQLVAPELQITTESSVAGYLNYMEGNVQLGIGTNVTAPDGTSRRDVQPDYAAEAAIADNADALIDRVTLLLAPGSMSAATRTEIKAAVESIAATSDANRLNRVRLAVLLTLAAPDYVVQR